MEYSDLFAPLESNQPKIVEDVKSKYHELFNTTKDAWLLNGFFDYYLTTNSTRAVEVLLGVREPHDKFLFDRIADSLRGPSKLKALTFLGYVVRKQPAWLYKITQHSLLKELLKLLKAESDILPMMSALLVLIILLPMIPGYIGPYLPDIFEIFCRVASWNTLNPSKLSEEHLVHLQVGLYALFIRLYGMFPCNFLGFLRHQYGLQENLSIFTHTIKPMLDTVKMHPLLVTASKEAETMQDRWKNKGHHDVIVECAKFALERIHVPVSKDGEQLTGIMTSMRPRGTLELTANLIVEERPIHASPLQSLRLQADIWSPSLSCGLATPPPNDISLPHTPVTQGQVLNLLHHKQEGSSPPEAAIEATPETTPVKDMRAAPTRLPLGSSAVRALNVGVLKSVNQTSRGSSPTPSNPSSPLKKEPSPFRFSIEDRRGSNAALQKIVLDRQKVSSSEAVEINTKNGTSHHQEACEDHEVLELMHKAENVARSVASCGVDSVLHETHSSRHPQAVDAGECDECQHSLGSPCTTGGLHMPNKQSVIDFARRVHRMRFNSLCGPSPALSAGTSPSDGAAFPSRGSVRRANSCPDMKRVFVISSSNSANSPLLDENEEEENKEETQIVAVNGNATVDSKLQVESSKQCLSLGTQTSGEQWRHQPYEHLFLAVFPSSQNEEVAIAQENVFCPSNILDHFIEIAVQEHDRDHMEAKKARIQELECEVRSLKSQLHLLYLQLQFERHRREVHAERNRRLAGKSRSNRALEEHNAALKEQVILLQKEYEKLQSELDMRRHKAGQIEIEHTNTLRYWQDKFAALHTENEAVIATNKQLENQLGKQAEDVRILTKDVEKAQSKIFDLSSEVKQLQESASVGERLGGELNQLQREIVLMGEMQQRHRERFAQLPLLAQHSEEAARAKDSFREEIAAIKQTLESRTSSLDATKARLSEMEAMIGRKDLLITDQKKLIKTMKDEYSAKLEATEDKYKSVRSINQRLQEQLLELYFKVEVLEARTTEKSTVLSASRVISASSSSRGSSVQQGASSPLSDTFKPLPTVTTATEMTDLHSIVDRELPPAANATAAANITHSPSTPPPRTRTDTMQRDSASSHSSGTTKRN